SRRENLRQKNPRLARAIRPPPRYRWPHVNGDRHSVLVRHAKYATELLNVLWVVEVNVRISEVQLESEMELWIFGATGDLFDCVVFERIDAAEAAQPVREARHLLAGPVVLGLHLLILVLDPWLIRIAKLI